MLQMFHLDVSKVDLGVAHVANSFTRMFQVFHLSRTNVVNVSSECFKSSLGVADHRPPIAAAESTAVLAC